VNADAGVVISDDRRLGGVKPDPDLRREPMLPTLLRKALLDRHRR
jgi:hypothetical protein